MADRYDYDSLKALATELGRPVCSLLAQASKNDPFYAAMPSRLQRAEWFVAIWEQFQFKAGIHLRRIHYVLVSQDPPIKDTLGSRYVNTEGCWVGLIWAARDARLLGLVPIEVFEDHRTDAPHEHLINGACDASLDVEEPSHLGRPGSLVPVSGFIFDPPKFLFEPAVIDQRYHLEIFAEKSTADDVILPLARRYGLNYISGAGDVSLTHCYRLLLRARASGRPLRVLAVTDFDKQGWGMAPAMARKIEFLIRNRGFGDIDCKVRHVVLTPKQIKRHRLPPTPMKDSVKGRDAFLEWAKRVHNVGGATELDALEAIRPGVLRRILVEAIGQYYDGDLDGEVEQIADDVRGELEEVRQEVVGRHEADLAALRQEKRELAEQCNADLEPIIEKYLPQFESIADRFNAIQDEIAEELGEEAPDVDEIEWPEPQEAEEDGDALYDSERPYLEQMDRYNERKPNGDAAE